MFMLHSSQASSLMKNPSNVPDCHARARDAGKLDGAGETLVTLGIIVLEADLKLDGFEKVSLLLIVGIVEQ